MNTGSQDKPVGKVGACNNPKPGTGSVSKAVMAPPIPTTMSNNSTSARLPSQQSKTNLTLSRGFQNRLSPKVCNINVFRAFGVEVHGMAMRVVQQTLTNPDAALDKPPV